MSNLLKKPSAHQVYNWSYPFCLYRDLLYVNIYKYCMHIQTFKQFKVLNTLHASNIRIILTFRWCFVLIFIIYTYIFILYIAMYVHDIIIHLVLR